MELLRNRQLFYFLYFLSDTIPGSCFNALRVMAGPEARTAGAYSGKDPVTMGLERLPAGRADTCVL